MAKNYALSEKAKADLRDIWNFTEGRWGQQQADTYYREIIKTIGFFGDGRSPGPQS